MYIHGTVQMMAVEMEQRASRPFASCSVEVDDPTATISLLQRKESQIPEVQTKPPPRKKKVRMVKKILLL